MDITNFGKLFAKFAKICIELTFALSKEKPLGFLFRGKVFQSWIQNRLRIQVSCKAKQFQHIDTCSDQLSVLYNSHWVMQLDGRTQMDLLHLSIDNGLWTSKISKALHMKPEYPRPAIAALALPLPSVFKRRIFALSSIGAMRMVDVNIQAVPIGLQETQLISIQVNLLNEMYRLLYKYCRCEGRKTNCYFDWGFREFLVRLELRIALLK